MNKIPSKGKKNKSRHKRRRKIFFLLSGLVVIFGIVSSTILFSPDLRSLILGENIYQN